MDRLRDGLLARMRNNPKAEMPFLDHLEELRWRILWSLLALFVGTGIGMILVLYFDVFSLLVAPARDLYGEDYKLINLSPPGPIFVFLHLSLTSGLVLAAPVIFYQIWSFLAPALDKHEKRAIVPALYMGLVLFLAGVALAYYFALPLSLRFFDVFLNDVLEENWTATNYIKFVVQLHLAFGIVFELPVVVLVLSALGLVTPKFLRSKRRHAIVGLLLLACMLSPGDLIQVSVLMMVPLIGLYELSIFLSALVWRKRRERERGRKVDESPPPSDSVAADDPGAVKPDATPYDHGDPAGTASSDPEAAPDPEEEA